MCESMRALFTHYAIVEPSEHEDDELNKTEDFPFIFCL